MLTTKRWPADTPAVLPLAFQAPIASFEPDAERRALTRGGTYSSAACACPATPPTDTQPVRCSFYPFLCHLSTTTPVHLAATSSTDRQDLELMEKPADRGRGCGGGLGGYRKLLKRVRLCPSLTARAMTPEEIHEDPTLFVILADDHQCKCHQCHKRLVKCIVIGILT